MIMEKNSYWDVTKSGIAFFLLLLGGWFTWDLSDMQEFLATGIILLLIATWIIERTFRVIENSLHYFLNNAQLIIFRTSLFLALIIISWGFIFLAIGNSFCLKLLLGGFVSFTIGILTDPKIIHFSFRKNCITNL
jgi:hypothetical protein